MVIGPRSNRGQPVPLIASFRLSRSATQFTPVASSSRMKETRMARHLNKQLSVGLACESFGVESRMAAVTWAVRHRSVCSRSPLGVPDLSGTAGPRHESRRRLPVAVCTENPVVIDYVTETPNVSSDDRAAPVLADPLVSPFKSNPDLT